MILNKVVFTQTNELFTQTNQKDDVKVTVSKLQLYHWLPNFQQGGGAGTTAKPQSIVVFMLRASIYPLRFHSTK